MPQEFRFGVATAGFQVEGGFNGPGEPRNNWFSWERDGRVEPSGLAVQFFDHYEAHLDAAASLGIDSFRLSVEWARLEPREGEYDDDAFERYGAILAACRDRGMEPLLTLCHFTHPDWAGERLWCETDAPERFAAYAAEVVGRLGDRCRLYVTLNEINVLALMSFVLGAFPPGSRVDGRSALRAADHLLAAHVLAYGEVKSRLPDAVVSTNNCNFSIYELDRLLLDLLLARSREVDRHELGAHLSERRRQWYATAAARSGTNRRWPVAEEALRRLSARLVDPVAAFPRAVEAIYSSPYPRTVDVVQLDYYDPETASHLQLPFSTTAGGRWPAVDRPLWDDPPDPAGLVEYAQANLEPGLDLWVVENGLCNRVRRGRSYPRLDGWTRERYLTENLAALADAVAGGLPVTGYWHWCLADNYEWGSYEPRFGLFGVDRERGLAWSQRDSMGGDAAGTYRRLIEGLRAGDRSVLES